jgi:3D (Asp-Asp-Asp) domain-containing protein
MRRTLVCLATVAFAVSATASAAQEKASDPVGDLIVASIAAPAISFSLVWMDVKATLYHAGRGIGAHDALGCTVAPMRTVAMDPAVIAPHSIVYVKQTDGLPLRDGTVHDGYWYVSDLGGAIRGHKIDLYTGGGAASMRPLLELNLKTLSISRVGAFSGCPPLDGGAHRLASAGAR